MRFDSRNVLKTFVPAHDDSNRKKALIIVAFFCADDEMSCASFGAGEILMTSATLLSDTKDVPYTCQLNGEWTDPKCVTLIKLRRFN